MPRAGHLAVRTVRDQKEEYKTDRDHRKKRRRIAAKKSECDAGVLDERQIQDMRNKKDRGIRRKVLEGEKFGQLVDEDYGPHKGVEEDY